MDTGLLDVLHDAGDVDIVAIGDGVDIDFDRVLQIAVMQPDPRTRRDRFTLMADIAVKPGAGQQSSAAGTNRSRADLPGANAGEDNTEMTP